VATTIYMLLSLIKNYGKRSLKHKATVLWNELPNTLKKVSSSKKFTHKVKSFLQSANTYC